MKQNDMTKPFDVIVIGGGATGAGTVSYTHLPIN